MAIVTIKPFVATYSAENMRADIEKATKAEAEYLVGGVPVHGSTLVRDDLGHEHEMTLDERIEALRLVASREGDYYADSAITVPQWVLGRSGALDTKEFAAMETPFDPLTGKLREFAANDPRFADRAPDTSVLALPDLSLLEGWGEWIPESLAIEAAALSRGQLARITDLTMARMAGGKREMHRATVEKFAATNAARAEYFTTTEVSNATGLSEQYLRRWAAAHVVLEEGRLTKADRSWQWDRALVEELADNRPDRKLILSYGVVFAPEKDWSVLYAGADELHRQWILDDLQAATEAGMRFADRYGLVVQGSQEKAQDVMAGSWFHDSNRDLRLHLHTHVSIPNMARDSDGTVRAIDAARLLYTSRAMAVVYGQDLRHRGADHGLTFEMGAIGRGWSATSTHAAIVGTGIAEGARENSSRHEEIISEIASSFRRHGKGLSIESAEAVAEAVGSAAYENARLRTRQPKTLPVSHDLWLFDEAAKAARAGHTREANSECWTGTQRTDVLSPAEIELLFAQLLNPATGLTERSSVFDLATVLEAIARREPTRLSGDQLQDLAMHFLTHEDVVAVVPPGGEAIHQTFSKAGRSITRTVGSLAYTTKQWIALEEHWEEELCRSIGANVAVVPPSTLATVRAERQARELAGEAVTLSEEQWQVIEELTTRGHRLQVVRGPAGAGKTTVLATAVDAWRREGASIHALATGSAQALGLSDALRGELDAIAPELDLAGENLARFIERAEHGLIEDLAGSVLLVDEHSMTGLRQFIRLNRIATEHGAKIVTIGDLHQLSSIEPGGAIAWIETEHPELVSRLRETHRLRPDPHRPEVVEGTVDHDTEALRSALELFRQRDHKAVLEVLSDDGRLHEEATIEEAVWATAVLWLRDMQLWQTPAIDDNGELLSQGSTPPTMVTAHNGYRDALNTIAHELRKESGELHGDALIAAGREFLAGDFVIAKRIDRKIKVDGRALMNNMRGEVILVDVFNEELVVKFEGQSAPVRLSREWIETPGSSHAHESLRHAYAMTTSASQGRSISRVSALMTDETTRQEAYVNVSRTVVNFDAALARREPLIDLVHGGTTGHDALAELEEQLETLDVMGKAWDRQGTKQFILSANPDALAREERARTTSLSEIEAERRERLAALEASRELAVKNKEREEARVSADAIRALEIQLGLLATRRYELIATPALLFPGEDVRASLPMRPNPAYEYEAQQVWDGAVCALARYRDVYGAAGDGIGDIAARLLGPAPTDPTDRAEWQDVADQLRRAEVLLYRKPITHLTGDAATRHFRDIARASASLLSIEDAESIRRAEMGRLAGASDSERQLELKERITALDAVLMEVDVRAIETGAEPIGRDLAAEHSLGILERLKWDLAGDEQSTEDKLLSATTIAALRWREWMVEGNAPEFANEVLRAHIGEAPGGRFAERWDRTVKSVALYHDRREIEGIGTETTSWVEAVIGTEPQDVEVRGEWNALAADLYAAEAEAAAARFADSVEGVDMNAHTPIDILESEITDLRYVHGHSTQFIEEHDGKMLEQHIAAINEDPLGRAAQLFQLELDKANLEFSTSLLARVTERAKVLGIDLDDLAVLEAAAVNETQPIGMSHLPLVMVIEQPTTIEAQQTSAEELEAEVMAKVREMLPKGEIAASTELQAALEIENRGNGADRFAEIETEELVRRLSAQSEVLKDHATISAHLRAEQAETDVQEARLRALVTDEQLQGPRTDGQHLTPAGELERLELRAEALAERISAKQDDVERSNEIVGTITEELESRGVDPAEAVMNVEEALRTSLVANAGEDYAQQLSPREEYDRLVALEESD